MRQILLLVLFFSILNIAAFADGRNLTMLKLRLSDRSLIAVHVDGKYFNKGTTSLTLDGLRPGLHRIEVYRTIGSRERHSRIYSGTIRLHAGTTYLGIVDVNRSSLRLHTQTGYDGYAEDNYRDNRRSERYNEYRDGPVNNPDPQDRNNYDRDSRTSRDDNDDDRDGYGSYPSGRSGRSNSSGAFGQRDMDDLRTRVESRITDSDKESLMKSVLQDRNASTGQVREMLSWLSFESTRLSFAKWAYSRVTDPRNYWKLEDAFTFSSSKTEFNEAIRGR